MTVAAPANPLQEFYETPGVPLRSGPDRAHRQARMLAGMLRGFSGPAVIVDLGCGDGSALADLQPRDARAAPDQVSARCRCGLDV